MNNERKYVVTVTNDKGEMRVCYCDIESMGSGYTFGGGNVIAGYHLKLSEAEAVVAELNLPNDENGFPPYLMHVASGTSNVLPKTDVEITIHEIVANPIETTYRNVAIKADEVAALKRKLIAEARENMTPEQRNAVFG